MNSITLPSDLAARIGAVAHASHRTPDTIVRLCILHYLPKLEAAAESLHVFQPPGIEASPTKPALDPAAEIDAFWDVVYATLHRKKSIATPAVLAWMKHRGLDYSDRPTRRSVAQTLQLSSTTGTNLPTNPDSAHHEDAEKILQAWKAR